MKLHVGSIKGDSKRFEPSCLEVREGSCYIEEEGARESREPLSPRGRDAKSFRDDCVRAPMFEEECDLSFRLGHPPRDHTTSGVR